MISNLACRFSMIGVALFLASCGPRENAAVQAKTTTTLATKPTPPLQLPVPNALPERFKNADFKNMEADELLDLGRVAADKKDYQIAAMAQYWHVQKSRTGQYDLACYLAQTGQIDPAFYWLQIAALEEGVDTGHAQRDEDLASLRADKRWVQVFRYMEECNRYFETAELGRTVLILPKDYKKTDAIGAVVWMHGFGSRPEDLVNESAQHWADSLHVALIGVSATKPRGPNSFVWADDGGRNVKRLHDSLGEVSDRVTIEKGKIVLMGFSQGAQVGLEIAAQYPEEYAGAIVLSPGAKPNLDKVKPTALLAKRGFVVSCGAKEHPGNVELASKDAGWLRQANAKLIYKLYPGVSSHSFPADFNERFPEWVTFIFKAKEECFLCPDSCIVTVRLQDQGLPARELEIIRGICVFQAH